MSSSLFNIKKAKVNAKKTQLILGNGSERGDFMNCHSLQNYFSVPHDGIQLMKTYYPHSAKWTGQKKISEMFPDPSICYAWDFEFDDYHPLDIDQPNSETLKQMIEIKSVGADIHLTLTIDTRLTNEELIPIYSPLKSMGRVYLRINHEANGAWFTHNKKSTYKEVNDFFVRSHELLKKIAPNVITVFSLTGDIFVGNQTNSRVTKDLARLDQNQLGEALAIADCWSIDKYVSLNWGWPYTHPGHSDQFFKGSVESWWRLIEETYLLMISSNQGKMKPLYLHEFNTDADVVGEAGQAQTIAKVYDRIKNSDLPWLAGICLYQFCDDGGLGLLQKTKVANAESEFIYRETESLYQYQKSIANFSPSISVDQRVYREDAVDFRWLASDDIEGIKIELSAAVHWGDQGVIFCNEFLKNIYLVVDGVWQLISPKESLQIKHHEFYLFVPPHKKNDELEFIHSQLAIQQTIEHSLAINESYVATRRIENKVTA